MNESIRDAARFNEEHALETIDLTRRPVEEQHDCPCLTCESDR